jgi:RNA polymerase sigma-70 factor (ECF subfamily)
MAVQEQPRMREQQALFDERDFQERFQRCEHEAWNLVINHYYPLVLWKVCRIAKHFTIAEDVAQETFTKAYENCAKYCTGDPIAPWLFTIGRNLLIDMLRKQNRSTNGLPFEPVACDFSGLEWDELIAILKRGVESLDPLERTVIKMLFLSGRSVTQAEVARELGISEATVSRTVKSAYAKLRKFLEEPAGFD